MLDCSVGCTNRMQFIVHFSLFRWLWCYFFCVQKADASTPLVVVILNESNGINVFFEEHSTFCNTFVWN